MWDMSKYIYISNKMDKDFYKVFLLYFIYFLFIYFILLFFANTKKHSS